VSIVLVRLQHDLYSTQAMLSRSDHPRAAFVPLLIIRPPRATLPAQLSPNHSSA
jgi:hypothetical protein